jgi:hypothetical protein
MSDLLPFQAPPATHLKAGLIPDEVFLLAVGRVQY